MMPAELQRIHAIVVDAAEVEIVSDEMRAVVESLWPELVSAAAKSKRDASALSGKAPACP